MWIMLHTCKEESKRKICRVGTSVVGIEAFKKKEEHLKLRANEGEEKEIQSEGRHFPAN